MSDEPAVEKKETPKDERASFDLSKPLLQRPHNRAAKNPDGSDKTHLQWLVEVLWGTGSVRNGILADKIEHMEPTEVRFWNKEVDQVGELLESLNIPWVAHSLMAVIDPERLKKLKG